MRALGSEGVSPCRSIFSGRGLHDRNATLWSSLALRTARHSVFFSGDTGLTSEYATIRERLGRFELGMLEVGAFHPSSGDIYLGPEHTLEAHAARRAGRAEPRGSRPSR